MDDGLGSLVKEMIVNDNRTVVPVNGHSYPFTLSTAESHVDLGRTELVHGKTRRARAHFRYALNDFVEAGEYGKAYSIAESYDLLTEIRRLFQKKISYFELYGTFVECERIRIVIRDAQKRNAEKSDDVVYIQSS